MPTTRRRRTTTPSRPFSLQETQSQSPSQPLWLEHPTLSGLRDRLQLVYDCWTLLELPDGTSRRPLYLTRGIEEPETCYIKRLEAARPTGFYRDALRTYAGMLSRLAWQALPDSLSQVATDVDGQGTDLGVFLFLADLPATCDCPHYLTGTMQILHILSHRQRWLLAMALTPPAASAYHPPPQVNQHKLPHLLARDAAATPSPAPLAGAPHPLWPERPPAVGLRLLDPARTP